VVPARRPVSPSAAERFGRLLILVSSNLPYKS